MEPRVIYEDEFEVVVDKPAGMVTNNAQTVRGETLQDWFDKHYLHQLENAGSGEFFDRGGIVHRLDKDTSGVMILAKTPEAFERLKSQFLNRGTKKTYIALVHGVMRESEGVIAKPVERHPKMREKFFVGADPARMAITEWKVLGIYTGGGDGKEQLSLLELKPLTGRTHQLRVHLKHLGNPIVSDPIYGGRKVYRKDINWCPRLFLHAAALEITDASGGAQKFEAPLEASLQKVLSGLTLK